jgi:hypothetical protein
MTAYPWVMLGVFLGIIACVVYSSLSNIDDEENTGSETGVEGEQK